MKDLINELFLKVTMRYVNMGAGQFLRDFRRSLNLKRSEELRKKVLKKRKEVEERNAIVRWDDVIADTSPGKVAIHGQLVACVRQYGCGPIRKNYTKAQLVRLCLAYDVPSNSRANKDTLAVPLAAAIEEAAVITFPDYLNNLRCAAVIDRGEDEIGLGPRVGIRIRRRDVQPN